MFACIFFYLISTIFEFCLSRILKVGSTVLLNFFAELDENKGTMLEATLRHRSDGRWVHWKNITNADGISKISGRKKEVANFMVVRNPLDRIISAWRDKFGPVDSVASVGKKKSYYYKLGRQIQMRYRGKISRFYSKRETISLQEFFQYLNDFSTEAAVFDPHWRPMTMRSGCSFCHSDFFIVKLENIDKELDFIYYKVNGVKIAKKFPTPKDKFKEEKKFKLLNHVPFALINQTLLKIYHDDFIAFDYQLPTKFEPFD